MNEGKTAPSFHNIKDTSNNTRERTFSNKFSKETLDRTMEKSKHLGQNTYAQVAQINVTEEMRTLNTGEYIKNVVEKNKLITNKPPLPRQRPKNQDPMDQMASIIGIKNVKWCDVKTHHDNNAARSQADGFEAVAKHSTYAAARVRYAALLIHATLHIDASKLDKISEAWSAKNFKSNILWIKADRETIDLIRDTRNSYTEENPGISLKEFTSKEFVDLKNSIDQKANLFRQFDKKIWTRISPGKSGTKEYKIEISHKNAQIWREINFSTFMEIPDCTFADLYTPPSASKENKRKLDFDHSEENPNALLKKIKEVWDIIRKEYQTSLVDYLEGASGSK